MVNGSKIGFYIRIFRPPIKVLSKGCRLTFAGVRAHRTYIASFGEAVLRENCAAEEKLHSDPI